jgi:DNA replication protein DnaC
MDTLTEPRPIGAILGRSAAFISKWQAEYALDPENTVKPGFCRHCGRSLGEGEDDKVMPMGAMGFLPNVCCHSCEQEKLAQYEADKRKQRDLAFARVVPTEFLHWDEAMGNGAALAKALGKLSFSAKRSMVLHGSTGSCKTRIAWEILKRVLEQPECYSWLWLDAFEVAKGGFPKEARTATYLVIDDLGNEQKGWKGESRWETELLFILRQRFDWHRPVILTTQLTPVQFKERFFNGTAADAIMRRFRQMTDSVATDGA